MIGAESFMAKRAQLGNNGLQVRGNAAQGQCAAAESWAQAATGIRAGASLIGK